MASSSEQPLSICAEILPSGTRTSQATETGAGSCVRFQTTYGPTSDDNNDQSSKASVLSEEEKEEYELISFYEFPLFDLLVNWVQCCLNMLWALVSGHCLRQLLFSSFDESSSLRRDVDDRKTTSGKWIRDCILGIQSIFQFPGVSSSPPSSATWMVRPAKPSPVYALPPALVALAILTMIALVVHPEGLTWVLLSNIR